MRIAYVCLDPGVPVFGCKGSSVHCQEVMRVFLQRGYRVDLFARRLGGETPNDLSKINVHSLGEKPDSDPAAREQALVNLNPVVYQRIQDAGPFDLVYERYSLWSFSAMQYAADNQIPGILEANSPLIHEQKTYRALHDEATAKTVRAKCFKHATSIVAVSDQVAEKLRSNYFAKYKTTAVANGVNCDNFDLPLEKSTADSADLTIGFVGTLKPWHGVSTLLDAFAIVRCENPKVRLRIVGDGPEREKLEKKLQRFPLGVRQAVEWLGAIPNSEMPEVLASLDIAVAPYPDLQDFYFSPLKILEYMAAGLPIVASRIGQIPSIIQQNKTGIMVKSGCEKELAAALSRLSRDRALRNSLGSAARRRAKEQHTWRHVVDRILATIPAPTLYREAC